MEFHWVSNESVWWLAPSGITVEQTDWYWEVKLMGCPLNHRYTSEIGAKMDAWQYVKKNALAFFGVRRVKLREAA
jgi:hypothetical protein